MEPDRSKEQNLVQLFDSWAKDYALGYSDGSPISHYFSTRLAHINALLDVSAGSKVLDVGCGPGMTIEPLARRGIQFFGSDLSKEMIRACHNRVGHLDMCHLTVARIQELPFSASCFDAIICTGVLEYVKDDGLALRELFRVLKPNGTIILSLLNKISPYNVAGNLNLAFRRQTRPEKMFTEWYCRSLLQANGLEIVDLLYFDFKIFLPPFERRYPRWSVIASQKLEFLRRSILRWVGTAFLVKAKKINQTLISN